MCQLGNEYKMNKICKVCQFLVKYALVGAKNISPENINGRKILRHCNSIEN